MFGCLSEFPRILVTGPQRSGTTICAKMIAYDTKKRLVDEMELIALKNSKEYIFSTVKNFVESNENFVLQLPTASSFCHLLPEIAVVFMIRDIKEITDSQERIGWKRDKDELLRYNLKEGIISEVKYSYWEEQKKSCKHYFEVKYDDLKKHPLWEPKHKRKYFLSKQIEFFKIFT